MASKAKTKSQTKPQAEPQTVETLEKKKNEIRYIVFSIIFFVVVSAAYIWITYAQYYYRYPSDLIAHVNTGKDISGSYSLMYILLGFLNKLTPAGLFIAIFLTAFMWLSVYVTKLLFSHINKDLSTAASWFWAWICHMVYPLLFMRESLRGVYNCNIIHNSTYQGMKPFMLLTVLFLYKVIYEYKDKGVPVKYWFAIAGSLFISTLMKPSFTVSFSVTLLCFLIYDFARNPKKCFLKCVALGTTVFPSFFIVLYQQNMSLNTESQVAIGLFKAFYATNNYPITGLLVSLAFPLLCLIFCFKDLKNDRYYSFAWINFLVNFLIAAFVYETGVRLTHGNFMWGLSASIGILYVVSINKYLGIIKRVETTRMIVLSMFLGMHLFSWFRYMYELVKGGYPW